MAKVVTGNDFTAEVRVQTKGIPMGFVADNVELELTLYKPCFVTCDCDNNQWKNVRLT